MHVLKEYALVKLHTIISDNGEVVTDLYNEIGNPKYKYYYHNTESSKYMQGKQPCSLKFSCCPWLYLSCLCLKIDIGLRQM